MNTPTTLVIKPNSAMRQLGEKLARIGSNHAHSISPTRFAAWESTPPEEQELCIQSAAVALKSTLRDGFAPMGCPRKAHLKSYLSTRPHPTLGHVIEGFDELYDEVRALFLQARRAPEVTLDFTATEIRVTQEANKMLSAYAEQLEKEHAAQNAAQREVIASRDNTIGLHEKEISRLLTANKTLADQSVSATRLSEDLRRQLGDLTTKFEERTRVNALRRDELVKLNGELQALRNSVTLATNKLHTAENEIRLLKSSSGAFAGTATFPGGISDSPAAQGCTFAAPSYYKNLTAEKLIEILRNAPVFKPMPKFIVLETTNSHKIDELNRELTTVRAEYQKHSDAQAEEVKRLRGDCKTYAENAEKWQRAAEELNSSRVKAVATLKEFHIESPTNSIPDMVRAACEEARDQRIRAEGAEGAEVRRIYSEKIGPSNPLRPLAGLSNEPYRPGQLHSSATRPKVAVDPIWGGAYVIGGDDELVYPKKGMGTYNKIVLTFFVAIIAAAIFGWATHH